MKKFAKILSLVLVTVIAACMLACAPSTVDEAKTKMKDMDYVVVTATKIVNSDGYVGGITATKYIDDGDDWVGDVITITAYLFETSKQAEAYAESWGKKISAQITVNGKWAYVGDEEAVKDFIK